MTSLKKSVWSTDLTVHCGLFPRKGAKGVSGKSFLGFGGVKATGPRREDQFGGTGCGCHCLELSGSSGIKPGRGNFPPKGNMVWKDCELTMGL